MNHQDNCLGCGARPLERCDDACPEMLARKDAMTNDVYGSIWGSKGIPQHCEPMGEAGEWKNGRLSVKLNDHGKRIMDSLVQDAPSWVDDVPPPAHRIPLGWTLLVYTGVLIVGILAFVKACSWAA